MQCLQCSTSNSFLMMMGKTKMPMPDPHDAIPTARGLFFSKYRLVVTMEVRYMKQKPSPGRKIIIGNWQFSMNFLGTNIYRHLLLSKN